MIDHVSPKLTLAQAREFLQSPPGFFKKKRQIEKIELFFLPSFIVEIQVTANNRLATQLFCIDAVLGSFAFFEASTTTASLSSAFKTCPFFLTENTVREKAVDEYRRHLLRTSLKMRYKFKVEKTINVKKIYYPFWIGYYKRKGKVDFDVIDAVGGEHQGVAMRPVFVKALLNEIEFFKQ